MNETYLLLPKVQQITYGKQFFDLKLELLSKSNNPRCNRIFVQDTFNDKQIKTEFTKEPQMQYIAYGTVDLSALTIPKHDQGYAIHVDAAGILLASSTEVGLFYACATWRQICMQSTDKVTKLDISDWPTLRNRGLMLDLSRGRVFTLEYLKKLVVNLAKMKINILQLYIEHTFQFLGKEAIWEGSGALKAEEIVELENWCKEQFVQLQPNLQSFGHCNRILTTKEYRHLRESDLYWTLSPSGDETYEFLGSLYAEYLPLFSSNLLNIDSDETYDLGSGKSKDLKENIGTGRLYLQHLLRLRELAAEHGKKIMVFGDVIVKHPELIAELPNDIVFLDWIYDPKDFYDTPSIFRKSGKIFWVCPGTGSWNSLFPRQDGAVKNIVGLVTEGIAQGAQGMLLCDWTDHGGYTMPKPSDYSYALGAEMSWRGSSDTTTKLSTFEQNMECFFREPGFGKVHELFASIYRLTPLWSKNRSQCVIALFDEPLTGRTLCAPLPPENIVPLQDLPEGIEGVLDEESKHLMRPIFQIPEETIAALERILLELIPLVENMVDPERKQQYTWIIQAFRIVVDKLRLGRRIRNGFLGHQIDVEILLDWELELRLLKQAFCSLQISFIQIWHSHAKTSEIDISLTYFAHIIERLDYLQIWIRRQRLRLQEHREPDYALVTYETAGYTSLPTY